MKIQLLGPAFWATILLFSCGKQETLFHALPPEQTGIHFANTITTTDTFNALSNQYIYHGAGLAAGDLNGDDRPDIFFAGNQVDNRLYLNRGGFQFEDVTEAAGLLADRWCTGVAMADVNDDGRLDIYVSVAGHNIPDSMMANLLYINIGVDKNGVPHFREQAEDYGLADTGYSTQAAFLDYDLDGDLDVYVLTNAVESYYSNIFRPIQSDGEALSTDRLYRNNGDRTFTNVSREAGIVVEGYGLGVQVCDLNFDRYPDIYVANDFVSSDLVWINNGNGTFSNRAGDYLKHMTHNGMGVDVADINNDALPDIGVLDMLPEDNYRQKMMIPYLNYDQFLMKKKLGYQDQYMRNTLQLHRGRLPDGTVRFSEIGGLAGISATDWSWSILFADFDHDGWKDIYITNGYRKDVTNLDFVNYNQYNQMFGTEEAREQKARSDLEKMPDVHVDNYLFRNLGNLTFENVAAEWGLDGMSFSNGAAYADLDRDGDLDLVVNNIDAPAFVYENRLSEQSSPDRNYLRIRLAENNPKITALNTKVAVYANGQVQYQEFSPYRGYQSSVEPILHFGLGASTLVDSVLAFWPDGAVTKMEAVGAGQEINLSHSDALRSGDFLPAALCSSQTIFEKVEGLLPYRHATDAYSDLGVVRTLLFEHDKTGPPLTVGDINGDGLEDLFAGGNWDQAGVFFIQKADGNFEQQVFPWDTAAQDAGSLLFDADGDEDLDLYVAHGGTRFPAGSEMYADRLYLNNGRGEFSPAEDALPLITTSTACVKATDYDGDGDNDLFVGGRIRPGDYPLAPRSYLFQNNNGQFRDVTPPDLQNLGMATDAIWTDFNGDGQTDLIVVGEWMPIHFFENRQGKLAPVEPPLQDDVLTGFPQTSGWWFHINGADLDGDGDTDYLVGNIGTNSKLKASPDRPVEIHAKDFDQNGAVDPLISCYIQDEKYLMHERDLLIKQIPGMKRRFPDYHSYAAADFAHTLSEEDLAGAQQSAIYCQESILLENLGKAGFKIHRLPAEAQFSPLMTSLLLDLDEDGRLDLLTAGNLHAAETMQIGWYDAGYGNLLLNQGDMNFHLINPLSAGFVAEGDVRRMVSLRGQRGVRWVVLGKQGDAMAVFRLKKYLVSALEN